MTTLRKNADERQCGAPSSTGTVRALSESSGDLRDTPDTYRVRGGTGAEPLRPKPYVSAGPGEGIIAKQSTNQRLRSYAQPCTEQHDVREPVGYASQDLFRRVGYHDLRAYTQLVDGGLSQGFVLVRHHTLVGTVQKIFPAGAPHPRVRWRLHWRWRSLIV